MRLRACTWLVHAHRVGCRPRQAYQMLLPIPDAEIGANHLITQNPGY